MNASIGDLIGGMADRIMQDMLAIGDVHMVPLTEQNGITPAQGEKLRNKFFVVLGFDNQDNVIGGVVINSRLNLNLPAVFTDYMVPIKATDYPFLDHDSFINCSTFIVARRDLFGAQSYRGKMSQEMVELVTGTLKESPTTNKKLLQTFGLL